MRSRRACAAEGSCPRSRAWAAATWCRPGLVVAGVGAVLAESQSAMQFLIYLGAAYLLWLGARVARGPAALPAENPGAVSALRGAATSGLNPKGLLLFFAVLPQFVARTAPWPVTVQLAVLGAVHIVACAVVYFGVVMGARRLLRSRPRAGADRRACVRDRDGRVLDPLLITDR